MHEYPHTKERVSGEHHYDLGGVETAQECQMRGGVKATAEG